MVHGAPLPSVSPLQSKFFSINVHGICWFFVSGRPELVLLDHGLYRELSNQFRLDYCHLWRSLIAGIVIFLDFTLQSLSGTIMCLVR